MRWVKLLTIILSLLLTTHSSNGAKAQGSNEWLGKASLFPAKPLDYREAQFSGSLYVLHTPSGWPNRMFANYSAGINRSIYRWNGSTDKPREFGLEIATFTQFIFEDPLNWFQVNHFNTEYKVGIHYNWQNSNHWAFRLRLYHISAHLGDDFIYRFYINAYLDNSRIYEVLDFSAAYAFQHFEIYGTVGIIPHSAYERKRLMADIGGSWSKPIRQKDWLRWMLAMHTQFEQETNFYPGTRLAAGIEIGKEGSAPLTIMLDVFHGYIPFSLFDKARITWIGGSMSFQPFN
ncbi:MAG: DUF1207 domain-containing protein [Bacteroidetes bacterium]|nr:DUF1207 domain-containing protein [Bacteroidota bacterium]MBU1578351.1 DUF1207 domain-containing protein [Bacteroidota bacterium]MBU2465913.1 DUF1207 domain-containing protein [Bacteroidota bacterium]MBU2557348.1 DUF1207 domain-containing protein [Bacteroidota bacterium]